LKSSLAKTRLNTCAILDAESLMKQKKADKRERAEFFLLQDFHIVSKKQSLQNKPTGAGSESLQQTAGVFRCTHINILAPH